jgi:hypothetical protein
MAQRIVTVPNRIIKKSAEELQHDQVVKNMADRWHARSAAGPPPGQTYEEFDAVMNRALDRIIEYKNTYSWLEIRYIGTVETPEGTKVGMVKSSVRPTDK